MSPSKATFLGSFKFAARGIAALFASQRNARLQLAAAAAAIAAGTYFNITPAEWIAVILCSAIVLAAEGINAALEYLADAVHPGHHPLVGKAKDIAAGAVLLCSIASLAVGAIIFCPHVFDGS